MSRLGDRFVLEREIGSGGMSAVFLGRDEVLDRPVAVKVLKPGFDDSEVGARFRQEGRTAAKLSHPNIVQVYDAGEDTLDGRNASYIVMEYVPGGDLRRLMDKKGPLPEAELSRIGAEVAAGLAHAHERGIVHRDVKPHNILLDERGRPKITDFGIARALDATVATRTGSYLGTALYSSPEQLKGERVTPKSDVYSLGATLYHAAVGEPPFGGAPMEVATQHVSKDPVPPRERGGSVDGELEALILRCLAKDPDSRPTADEVRAGLRAAGTEARATRAYAAPPPPAKGATRGAASPTRPAPDGMVRSDRRGRLRPILAALALVAILALIAAIAVPMPFGETGQPERPAGQNDRASNKPSGGGERDSDRQAAAGPSTQPAGQQSSPRSDSKETGGDGDLAQEAAQTVEEFYTSAASGDYEESSELLTAAYRQSTFPDRATFEGTFGTLNRVEFTSGPDAQVSGDTATVSFSTNAYHTDRVDQTTGTATLVQESGDWKIDALNVA
jgi:eukaryotic-like serine/threonine-protein kinase